MPDDIEQLYGQIASPTEEHAQRSIEDLYASLEPRARPEREPAWQAELQRQREWYATRTPDFLSTLSSRMPGAMTVQSISLANQFRRAQQALEAGNPSQEDLAVIARQERLDQLRGQQTGLSGFAERALELPGQAAELLAGGRVASAIPGLGALGTAGAGRAAQVAGTAGRLVAGTAATPGMYLPGMMEENRREGRDPLDLRGLPAPFALGLIQNAIFQGGGTLAERLGARVLPLRVTAGRGLVGTAERVALRGATGLAEQQVADALTTSVDRMLGLHSALDTGYGDLGRIMSGERDAWWHAASGALMFTAFGGIHELGERPALPHVAVEGEGGPGWTTYAPRHEVMQRFQEAGRALRDAGPSEEQAAQVINQVNNSVQVAAEHTPILTAEQRAQLAQTFVGQGVPEAAREPVRAYAEAATEAASHGPVLSAEEREQAMAWAENRPQRPAPARPPQPFEHATPEQITDIGRGLGARARTADKLVEAMRAAGWTPEAIQAFSEAHRASMEGPARGAEPQRAATYEPAVAEPEQHPAPPEPQPSHIYHVADYKHPERSADAALNLLSRRGSPVNLWVWDHGDTGPGRAQMSPRTVAFEMDRSHYGEHTGQEAQAPGTIQSRGEGIGYLRGEHPLPYDPALRRVLFRGHPDEAAFGRLQDQVETINRERADAGLMREYGHEGALGPIRAEALGGPHDARSLPESRADFTQRVRAERASAESRAGESASVQRALAADIQGLPEALAHSVTDTGSPPAVVREEAARIAEIARAAAGVEHGPNTPARAGGGAAGGNLVNPELRAAFERVAERYRGQRGENLSREPVLAFAATMAEYSRSHPDETIYAPSVGGQWTSLHNGQGGVHYGSVAEVREAIRQGQAGDDPYIGRARIVHQDGSIEVIEPGNGGAPGGHELTEAERGEATNAGATPGHLREIERTGLEQGIEAAAAEAERAGNAPRGAGATAEVVSQGAGLPGAPGEVHGAAGSLIGPGPERPGPGTEPGRPAPGTGTRQIGFGAPVTPEERASLPGGGQPIAGAERGEGPIAVRLRQHALENAQIDQQRQREGKAALMSQAQQSDPAVWQEAMQRLAADPEATNNLVAELLRKPRPTSPVESMLLLHRQIALRNELERTHLEYLRGVKPGGGADAITLNALEGQVDALEAQRDRLDRAVRDAGSEAGRAFRIRRVLMQEDYTFAGMAGRSETAKRRAGQGDLTDAERTQVRDMSEALTRAHQELNAAKEEFDRQSPIFLQERGIKPRTTGPGEYRSLLGRAWDAVRHWFGGEEAFAPLPRSVAVDMTHEPWFRQLMQAQENAVAGARNYAQFNQQWTPKPLGERIGGTILKVRQNMVISGLKTLAKISTASLERFVQDPITQLAGRLWESAPFAGWIVRQAPNAGFHSAIEVEAQVRGYTDGMRDAWDRVRTGQSSKDVLREGADAPRGLLDLQFGLHGALKAPAVAERYSRELLYSLENHIRAGGTASEAEVLALQGRALREAKKAEFGQDNWLTSWVERLKEYNKPAYYTARALLLPVMKVPTNHAFEVLEHAYGLPVGLARVAAANFQRAWGNAQVTPAMAQSIRTQLARGSLGGLLFALAYANPQMFGGYWSRGRREEDVPAMGMRLWGADIPGTFTHNPMAELTQLGATVRRASDEIPHTRGGTGGLGATARGITAGLRGWLEEVPLGREMLGGYGRGIQAAFSENQREQGRWFGETLKSLVVPQLLQWLAGATDPAASGQPQRRAPQTPLQYLETGIPGLRQQVPIAPPPRVHSRGLLP